MAGGLDYDSRSMRAMAHQKLSMADILLAGINDRLSMILWSWSKDSEKGKNRPVFLVDLLQEKGEAESGFISGKAFEEAREKMLEGIRKEGK